MRLNNLIARHSRAGGNPASSILREADKTSVLTRYAGVYLQLDSRLRGNDVVLS